MTHLITSLLAAWALFLGPALCMGGLLPHACEPLHACHHEGCGEAKDPHNCHDDPCGIAVIRQRDGDPDEAATSLRFELQQTPALVEGLAGMVPEVPVSNAEQCFSLGNRFSFAACNPPLLI